MMTLKTTIKIRWVYQRIDISRGTLKSYVQEREGSGGGEGERFRPEEILASTTDHELWRLEVERVAPSLKITVKSEARDWRAHLEQMHQYR